MSNVYFPAHVVLVLRKIVNVISSLSISNQYLLLKKANADEERPKFNHHPLNETFRRKSSLGQAYGELKRREWPWYAASKDWDWRRLLSGAFAEPHASRGASFVEGILIVFPNLLDL